ncbi:RHS repeat domain-containing protein [Pseudochrobactrum sp. MP213Fo]|uniref:RHS repeat domain-containing protein n=1 Tax=Pseudochrobactrum sp. MP213Fo TaxID=3022250 RepID=UPI003BA1283C
MANYYTHAGNFTQHGEGNVDPRTGLFSVSITLCEFRGGNLIGPSQPVILTYSPLSSVDYGLGIGWCFAWTTWDTNSGYLYSKYGESLNANLVGNVIQIEQQKIKTMMINQMNNKIYKVTHATGEIEVLSATLNYQRLPTTIHSPEGNSISLNWNLSNGHINNISDDLNNYFSVSYDGSGLSTITVFPGSDESYTITATMKDRYLNTLKIGNNDVWKFTYDDENKPNGYPSLLSQVTYPSGLVESVIYKPRSMYYNANSNRDPLPSVSQYTINPHGKQPPKVVQYSYSNNYNYLGLGNDSSAFNENSDNSYNGIYKDSIKYTSTEDIMSGSDIIQSTIRTYNMYHLLTNERINNTNTSLETTINYEIAAGVGFQNQCIYFQKPLTVTKTYIQDTGSVNPKSRTEVSTFSYDKSGNKISQTLPDGVITTWAYAPLEGDDNTPAKPSGMVPLVIEELITYPTVGAFNSMKFKKTYKYKLLDVGGSPSDPNNPIKNMIVLDTETHTLDDQPYYSIAHTYYEKGVDFSRFQTTTETYISDALDKDGKPLTYSTTSSFKFDHSVKNALTTQTTIVSHDKLSSVTSRTWSTLTGVVTGETNEQGVRFLYTYDCFARPLTTTTAAGNTYSNTIKYDYAYELLDTSETIKVPTITKTVASGAKEKTWLDGLMREIQLQRMRTVNNAAQYVTGRIKQHDAMGRIVVDTEFDQVNDVAIKNSTSITYDDWGAPSKITRDDGSYATFVLDVVDQQVTAQWSGGGNAYIIGHTNNQNLLTKAVIYDKNKNPYASLSYEYDGGRRLRSKTDALSHTTTYQYDNWHRVAQVTLSDGTVTQREYVPFSSAAAQTSVKIKSGASSAKFVEYGTQVFDGFLRPTEATVGARTTKYAYSGASNKPSAITAPDGSVLNYSYIPELGNVMQQCTDKDGNNLVKLSYDQKTGFLTEGETRNTGTSTIDTTGRNFNRQCDVWGRVAMERMGPTFSAMQQYKYSLFGRLISYSDPGNIYSYTYNKQGQVTLIKNKNIETSITYNTLGEVASYATYQAGDGEQPINHKVLQPTYDEFHREINRKYTINSKTALSIDTEYTISNLISKVTTSGDDNLVESFTYDARSRILSQSFNKPCLKTPHNQLASQVTYTHDYIDNILSADYTCADNSSEKYTMLRDNANDICQLTGVTSNLSAADNKTFNYDANGRMIADSLGNTLEYDLLGRLSKVTNNTTSTNYIYDAINRLRTQSTGQVDNKLYYRNGVLQAVEQYTDGMPTKTYGWMRTAAGAMASFSSDTSVPPKFLITNKHSTILAATDGSQKIQCRQYTAFGDTQFEGEDPALGFNGELFNPAIQSYQLGSGYRAYSPGLMQFTAPDSWSPFGKGGINPYAYCNGDPVNKIDPSGHSIHFWFWFVSAVALVMMIVPGVQFGAAVAAGEDITITMRVMTVAKTVVALGLVANNIAHGIEELGAQKYVVNQSGQPTNEVLKNKKEKGAEITGDVSDGLTALLLLSMVDEFRIFRRLRAFRREAEGVRDLERAEEMDSSRRASPRRTSDIQESTQPSRTHSPARAEISSNEPPHAASQENSVRNINSRSADDCNRSSSNNNQAPPALSRTSMDEPSDNVSVRTRPVSESETVYNSPWVHYEF